MEVIGRLTLDSEGEETAAPSPQRASTPALPWSAENQHCQKRQHTRSRRQLLLRSISAEPWTSPHTDAATITHVRDSRRPGRSLARESSHRKQKSTSPDSRGGWCGCRGLCCLLLSCSIATTTLLCLLAMDPLLFIASREPTCVERRNTAIPLSELKTQLKKNIVGQSVAIETLTHSLGMFGTSASQRMMVIWLAGWEGSGKTLTINIMRSVLLKEFKIHTILSLLLPQTPKGLEKRMSELLAALDPCTPNLVIIDGWDERDEAQIPLTILSHLLKGLHESETVRGNTSKVLVVLSGTVGAQEVWEHFRVGSEGAGHHTEGPEQTLHQEHGFERDLSQRRGSEVDLSQRIGPERDPNLRRESEGDLNRRIEPERNPNHIKVTEGDLNQRSALEEDLTHTEEGERNSNQIKDVKGDLNQRRVSEEDLKYKKEPESNPSHHHHHYHKDHITNLSLKLQQAHQLTKITRNIALVPFLPLDAIQVRLCITRELLRLHREEVVLDNRALASLTQQVLLHTEWVPGSDPPLARHGCKRVPSLLALLLPSPDGL